MPDITGEQLCESLYSTIIGIENHRNQLEKRAKFGEIKLSDNILCCSSWVSLIIDFDCMVLEIGFEKDFGSGKATLFGASDSVESCFFRNLVFLGKNATTPHCQKIFTI